MTDVRPGQKGFDQKGKQEKTCIGEQWKTKSKNAPEDKRGQISSWEGLVRVFRPLPAGTSLPVCIFEQRTNLVQTSVTPKLGSHHIVSGPDQRLKKRWAKSTLSP